VVVFIARFPAQASEKAIDIRGLVSTKHSGKFLHKSANIPFNVAQVIIAHPPLLQVDKVFLVNLQRGDAVTNPLAVVVHEIHGLLQSAMFKSGLEFGVTAAGLVHF